MTKPTAQKFSRSRAVVIIVGVLIFIAGLLTVAYPIVASTLNNIEQARAARGFTGNLESIPPNTQMESLEAAIEYNKRIDQLPIYDAWNGPDNPVSPEYGEYLNHLADTTAMGQITIPAIDVNLPIYHGTDEETLDKGVGHLYGTSLPVGGEGTHSSLTAHTGMVNATLFNNLDQVVVGDVFYVRTVGQDLKYEVRDIDVVLPHETESLEAAPGQDLITLITCTPYGINSHRLLVTGHRVPMDPEEAKVFQDSGAIFEGWMYLVIGIVGAALLIVIVLMRRTMTRKSEQDN